YRAYEVASNYTLLWTVLTNVYNVIARRIERSIVLFYPTIAFSVGRDGTLGAFGAEDGRISIVRLEDLTEIARLRVSGGVTAFDFSANNELLAAGSKMA